MSTLAIHSQHRELIKPEPRSPISIRVATERDLKFIDSLQKKHGKAVAFASHKELRSYIEQEQTALIAEICDKVTGWQGDKVTDTDPHPVTLSLLSVTVSTETAT